MSRRVTELSSEEFNDLNAQLAPISQRAHEFDALWAFWSQKGDFIAAVSVGLAAAVCRAFVQEAHSAWFVLHRVTRAVEDIDEPIETPTAIQLVRDDETMEAALDRLVFEIENHDQATLSPLLEALPRIGMRTVHERLRQLRACPEWTNPHGILRNHPVDGCVILFKTLLVSPVVFCDSQNDLVHVTALRREARRFREKVERFDQGVGSGSARPRAACDQWLPNLFGDSDRFRELLDQLCVGDVRTRHSKPQAERVAIVRDVAEHFRRYLQLSRETAAEAFGTEPWSTGIATLAHSALNRLVTTEDVRGALKNWSSD